MSGLVLRRESRKPMFQFFMKSDQVEGKIVRIYGDDFHHMKQVIRLREEEKFRISLSDGDQTSFFCLLKHYERDHAVGEILLDEINETELEGRIVLFQGLPKSDKMEWIIQKSVELGVDTIVPVAMQNCVVKLDEKKANAKQLRWQSIAETAAKQSKRSKIPTIETLMKFDEAVAYAKQLHLTCLPYENEEGIGSTRSFLSKVKKDSTIGVFIGPEGGFSAKEMNSLPDSIEKISLGKRILRTETAAMMTLAMLMLEMEFKSDL